MNFIENYKANIAKSKAYEVKILPTDIASELWLITGKKIYPEFVMDENAKKIGAALSAQTRKGSLILGSKGIGKTLALQIFYNILSAWSPSNVIYKNVRQIQLDYKREGLSSFERLIGIDHLILDDCGTEDSEFSDYGNKKNLIAELLLLRYDEFQMRGRRTYLTTNLDKKTLQLWYGERLMDRFNEMFNFIVVTGESKR
jgi:DNA replication protein DnaC